MDSEFSRVLGNTLAQEKLFLFLPVVGRIISQDVHNLIPGACEQRRIKVADHLTSRQGNYPAGPNVVTRILPSERERSRLREDVVTEKQDCGL